MKALARRSRPSGPGAPRSTKHFWFARMVARIASAGMSRKDSSNAWISSVPSSTHVPSGSSLGLTLIAKSKTPAGVDASSNVKRLRGALHAIGNHLGPDQVAIALEKGEITGRVWDIEGIRAARPHWLTDGSINLVAQLAPPVGLFGLVSGVLGKRSRSKKNPPMIVAIIHFTTPFLSKR